MRSLTALLVLCVTAVPAVADRSSNFSAQLIGAETDTAGVITSHDAHGWSMKVRPKRGAKPVVIAAPTIPALHGDFVVVVGPGRKRIAWVLIGDVNGVPADDAPCVWVFRTSDGSVTTTTFGELFDQQDRDAVPLSSGGAAWYADAPALAGSKITLQVVHGGPVVIDLKAGTVKRR